MDASLTTFLSEDFQSIFKRTYCVHEEPMFCNCLGVEKERCSYESLRQEVASKSSKPFEDWEPSARLQYEECNDLLQKEANDDSRPINKLENRMLGEWEYRPGNFASIPRWQPKAKLEDSKTQYWDRTISIICVLHKKNYHRGCICYGKYSYFLEWKSESGTKDNTQET